MAKPRTILDYLRLSADFLAQKGIETSRLDAEVLLGHVLDKERVFLYVHFDQPLEVTEVDMYRELIVRRGQREPLAHIIGEKEFYSRPFRVTPSVLVPRPETELLVETVIAWACDRNERAAIADIGTGSGVIAITLAHELDQASLFATDASPEALAIAQENARKLGAFDRIQFMLGQWLQPLRGQTIDAVVSNPPYIPTAHIAHLEPEVAKYEPRLALDGGGDGLDAYRKLLPQAAQVVRPDGMLFSEVGQGQAAAVAAIGSEFGWIVQEVVADHAGIERVVCLRRGGA